MAAKFELAVGLECKCMMIPWMPWAVTRVRSVNKVPLQF